MFGEPGLLSGAREVGKEEEGDKADDHSSRAFDYVEPSERVRMDLGEGVDGIYLQPASPPASVIPLRTPAAKTPPKPFAIVLPQYMRVTRGAISLGLYHELIRRLWMR